jgi:hypothetical protein
VKRTSYEAPHSANYFFFHLVKNAPYQKVIQIEVVELSGMYILYLMQLVL